MIRTTWMGVLVLVCTATWAQEPSPPQPVPAAEPAPTAAPPAPGATRKYYLSLALGRSHGVNEDPKFEDDTNVGLTAGMRLDGHWSAEIFYHRFALGADTAEALIGGSEDFRVDSHLGLAGVYRVPLSDSIGAYGRVGLGWTGEVANQRSLFDGDRAGQSDSRSFTEPSVGAGLVVGTMRSVGVKLEANRFTRSGISTYQLGLDIRF